LKVSFHFYTQYFHFYTQYSFCTGPLRELNCTYTFNMDYTALVAGQMQQHGPKAILFASDLMGPLRASQFSGAELQVMPQVSSLKLEAFMNAQYEASKAFFIELCSTRTTRTNGTKKNHK